MHALLTRLAPTTLRGRLALLGAGLSGVVLLIAAVYGSHRQAVLTEHTHLTDTHALAAHIAAVTANDVAATDQTALARALGSFDGFAQVRAIALADRQGHTLAAVARDARGSLRAVDATRMQPPPAASDGMRFARASEGAISVWSPIGPIAPMGWVQITSRPPANGLGAAGTLAGMFGAALLIACATWLTPRFMRRPLDDLAASTQFASDLAHSSADAAPHPAATVETRQLAGAVENLARQLDALRRAHAQSEADRRAISEGALDCIVTIDARSRIVEFNPAAEATFGYTRDEVLHQRMEDCIIPPDLRTAHAKGMQRYLQGGAPQVLNRLIEVRAMRKNGQSFPAELTVLPVAQQGAARFTAYLRDISARKAAQASIAASEAKLRGVLDNLSALVFETDAEMRWTYLNPTWMQLNALPVERVLGRSALVWLPLAERRRVRTLAATLAAGKAATLRTDIRATAANGEALWLDTVIRPVHADDGSLSGFAGSANDITMRKELERSMRDAKLAAEQANRTKSDFLANISHEIRTPMNAIIGMTDLALENVADEAQHKYLEMVKQSADTLLKIINDILDFSKIESGKLDFERIGFGLRDCVALAHDTLREAATRRGLTLSYHVDAMVPDQLVGDPHRVRQILINLISNALKFTEQGHINVHVALAESHADEALLQISVEDTGIGIADDKQQVIFEAFAQADTTSTRRYGGTGLGLAICAHLVRGMGGRMWVDSTPGKGSTFHFTARFARARTPSLVHARNTDLTTLRVLVAAGNEVARRHLVGMLESWHMVCTVRDSASAALRTLAAAGDTPYQVMVVDADLGDMDAFDFFETLQQQVDTLPPVRLMTANAGQRGDAARCRELGIQAYLTRPLLPSDLLDAILQALGADGAQPLITRHSLREQRRRLNVLLVEDNKVNQTLALRLLEKLGHVTLLAHNGREALEACASTRFDVILMDVQMPEMDGFEATARLREIERAREQYTPIIAMTANAMPGDRERCLAAGMDEYIAKPVQPAALAATLASIGDSAPPSRYAPSGDAGAFDLSTVLSNLGDDRDLFDQLAELYLVDEAQMRAQLARAADSGDLQATMAATHAIKGAVTNFSADKAVVAATRIESLCREGRHDGLRAALTRFDAALDDFAECLRAATGESV